MSLDWQTAWQAVIGHPLFSIGITLAAYQLAAALYQRSGLAFMQPVLVAMLLVILAVQLCGLDVRLYLRNADIFMVLLGPCIVALAIPLYLNLRHIRRLWRPVLLTLLLAGVFATLLGSALLWLLGASEVMQLSMLSKSVTSPIAILIAPEIGGIPALAAIFALLTGVIGGVLGPELLKRCGIHHPAAQGMALGLTAHAVGTARALQENEECGGFSALAMSLMGVSTAVLLPLAVSLLS
jgi:predicted murein hydrolase (TIGR00659 family)